MSSLLPVRSVRLLFARRPAVTRLAHPPTPLPSPNYLRLFSTGLPFGQPSDPSCASADGLRNNRDLHSTGPSPASSHPTPAKAPPAGSGAVGLAGVSCGDAELLSKLSESDARPASEVPSYAMVFTCKKCDERSAHRISKQGYHHGTVLVTCPGCKNRHLISDHLKIFSDNHITLEDILAKKGEVLKKKKVTLADGSEDLEFWDDDSVQEMQLALGDPDRP